MDQQSMMMNDPEQVRVAVQALQVTTIIIITTETEGLCKQCRPRSDAEVQKKCLSVSSALWPLTLSTLWENSADDKIDGWPRWHSWMRVRLMIRSCRFNPRQVSNILSWRLIMKYFLLSFCPFSWYKKGSCQFLAKECAQYWLTA